MIDAGKMKNMVVLKNLPSNIIDEAIVILKPNVKSSNVGAGITARPKNKDEYKVGTKDYIINEAQMVISNYISDIDSDKKMKYKNMKSIENKYKILKTVMIAFTVLGALNYMIKLI